jgi:hypothetical protein
VPPALRLGVAALGCASFALLAVTLAGRLLFPWPLEWEEGAILHHSLRLLEGAPLYTAPRADFVPFIYPPLAFAAFSLPVGVLGPALPAARTVSVLALCLTPIWLGRTGAREAGSPAGGWLAAGFYALGFVYTGAWYDVVRVDSIFIALVALGLERLSAGHPRSALAVFALSCFAKQPGLIFLGAASGWWLWREPAQARGPVVAVALALCALLGACHLATGGWFTTYVFWVPSAHPTEWGAALRFLLLDLPLHLPLLLGAAALGLLRHRHAPRAVDALLPAALLVSAMGWAHQGGFDNVRMPALALLAVASAPEIVRLLSGAAAQRAAVGALTAAQALLLAWWPPDYWPRPDASERFEVFAGALRECAEGGRSVALDHTLLTGTPYFHLMGLNDLIFAEGSPLAAEAARHLQSSLGTPAAPAALAISHSFVEIDRAMAGRYHPCREVEGPPMTTGTQPTRTVIWKRLQASDAAGVGAPNPPAFRQ